MKSRVKFDNRDFVRSHQVMSSRFLIVVNQKSKPYLWWDQIRKQMPENCSVFFFLMYTLNSYKQWNDRKIDFPMMPQSLDSVDNVAVTSSSNSFYAFEATKNIEKNCAIKQSKK